MGRANGWKEESTLLFPKEALSEDAKGGIKPADIQRMMTTLWSILGKHHIFGIMLELASRRVGWIEKGAQSDTSGLWYRGTWLMDIP